jgi:hypothetical protein
MGVVRQMYANAVSATPSGQRAEVSRRRGRWGFRCTPAGYPIGVVGHLLARLGVRSWQLHGASLGGVWLSLGLWIRAKTVDQDERGNAERRAIFVGLWPAMLWLLGDSVERASSRRRRLPLQR